MTNDNGELMACPFEHKGYQGTAEFSLEDDCLHGSLIGIKDLVVYQGETLKELKQSFIEAVDDYLETCEELNLPPNKPDYTRPDSRDDGQLKELAKDLKQPLRAGSIRMRYDDFVSMQNVISVVDGFFQENFTALSQASGSDVQFLSPEAEGALDVALKQSVKFIDEPAKPKEEEVDNYTLMANVHNAYNKGFAEHKRKYPARNVGRHNAGLIAVVKFLGGGNE